MRDAITAHKSLYKAGFLHRDVSPNNLIITDHGKPEQCHGVLIDLDLAKELVKGRSGAHHLTGTKPFMAIDVLRRQDHTYRHDLESVLYVLLWLCAVQAWHNGLGDPSGPPPRNMLDKWKNGSLDDVADAKEGHMFDSLFERILNQFPSSLTELKELCCKFRLILFGSTSTLNLLSPEKRR